MRGVTKATVFSFQSARTSAAAGDAGQANRMIGTVHFKLIDIVMLLAGGDHAAFAARRDSLRRSTQMRTAAGVRLSANGTIRGEPIAGDYRDDQFPRNSANGSSTVRRR